MKRNKVKLIMYSNINFGDDLFLEILLTRYPLTKFVIHAPKIYKKTLTKYKNLIVYPSNTFVIKIVNSLLRIFTKKNINEIITNRVADMIIIIGGSMFNQGGRKWKYSQDGCNNIFFFKKPTYLIGCNFGPFNDPQYLNEHLGLFRNFKDVCFRDIYSYKLFETNKNSRYANDIAFNYVPEHTLNIENSVFISVINLRNRKNISLYHEDYIQKIVEIINEFTGKGYSIKLASFCKTEGDEDSISEILSSCKLNLNAKIMINVIYYRGDTLEIISAIAISKFVLATRFHAFVIGLVHNKIVFPIIYDEKISKVIDDNVPSINRIFIQDIKKLDPVNLVNFFENSEHIEIKRIIDNSKNQFKLLDEVLK